MVAVAVVFVIKPPIPLPLGKWYFNVIGTKPPPDRFPRGKVIGVSRVTPLLAMEPVTVTLYAVHDEKLWIL